MARADASENSPQVAAQARAIGMRARRSANSETGMATIGATTSTRMPMTPNAPTPLWKDSAMMGPSQMNVALSSSSTALRPNIAAAGFGSSPSR